MHKLEQIEAFGAFLDFLSNPDEYKQLVKEVREAAKEYKELIEKKRGIKNIDKWRAEEGVRLGKVEDAISARENALDKMVTELKASQELASKEVAETRKKQATKARELTAREKLVTDIEKRADKLKSIEGEYLDKLNKLNSERNEVKQQKAKLEAALKGLS